MELLCANISIVQTSIGEFGTDQHSTFERVACKEPARFIFNNKTLCEKCLHLENNK